MLTNFRSLARRYGVLAAVHFAIYRVVQRLIVLDVQCLMRLDTNASHSSSDDSNGVVRLLDEFELRNLADDEENDLTAHTIDRLQVSNNFCFGAVVDNRIAGYAWFSLESVPADHNRGNHPATGVGLAYPANMAFMYNAFVMKCFRGIGIYPLVIRESAKQLRDLSGVEYVICTAEWTNYAAKSSCRKAGYKPIGLVWQFGYPGRLLTILPRSAQELGISHSRNGGREAST